MTVLGWGQRKRSTAEAKPVLYRTSKNENWTVAQLESTEFAQKLRIANFGKHWETRCQDRNNRFCETVHVTCRQPLNPLPSAPIWQGRCAGLAAYEFSCLVQRSRMLNDWTSQLCQDFLIPTHYASYPASKFNLPPPPLPNSFPIGRKKPRNGRQPQRNQPKQRIPPP